MIVSWNPSSTARTSLGTSPQHDDPIECNADSTRLGTSVSILIMVKSNGFLETRR